MGQTPDQLREDIEAAREDFGETLEAIGDKVSPKQVAKRRIDSAKAGLGTLRDQVMGTAEDVSTSAGERLGDLGEQGKSQLTNAGESLAQVGSSAGAAVRQAPRQATARTRGNPLAAGLIAVGVGALAASLIPMSEAETRKGEQISDTVLDPLLSQADEIKESVVADLRDNVQSRQEALVDTATTAAQEVGEQVKTGVNTVAGEAADASAEVADQAQRAAQKVQAASQ